jgi:hypothetical protein
VLAGGTLRAAVNPAAAASFAVGGLSDGGAQPVATVGSSTRVVASGSELGFEGSVLLGADLPARPRVR